LNVKDKIYFISVCCVESISTTSKSDANQMAYFKLAQALFRRGIVEHYSYYMEQAAINRNRNPRNPIVSPSVAANSEVMKQWPRITIF
jgi:dihydrodipicolinate synthase/N-acetylneuraminate lyase